MKDQALKDSTRGRIKSQRKLENTPSYQQNNLSSNIKVNAHSTLIRQYDTKTSINYDRINQLKQKYSKHQFSNTDPIYNLNDLGPHNVNPGLGLTLNGNFTDTTPQVPQNLSALEQNLTNNHYLYNNNESISLTAMNCQSAQISDFTTQLKQRYLNISQIQQKQKQRQLVRIQNTRRVHRQNLSQFRRKAQLTNNTISQRLNYIQQELGKIKYLRQSQLRIRQQQTSLQKEKQMEVLRLRELDLLKSKQRQIHLRQIARNQRQRELRMQLEMEKQNQGRVRIPESIKVSKVQQIFRRDHKQKYDQRQRSRSRDAVSDNIETKIAKRSNLQHILVEQSNIKLLGQFKEQFKISQQFIMFINRLKDQIILDSDFTQLLLSLSLRERQMVKQVIRKYHAKTSTGQDKNTIDNIDYIMQFFTVTSAQCDPLKNQIRTDSNVSIQSITRKLYQFYLKIEQHYQVKLHHKFQLNTIQLLFQQIAQKQITVGHLISYINMRTGKQFRNRCLIKLLRRLGANGYSSHIDKTNFIKGFVVC